MYSNFTRWFELNLGFLFVNGRKQQDYANYLYKKYSTPNTEHPIFCKKYKKRNMSKQSICQEAHTIVNERNEEKERMYGPFSKGMDRAASIFNGMTGLDVTGKEMYLALIALKFSRESYNHKRDNLLDAVSYIQGLDNYLNETDEKKI